LLKSNLKIMPPAVFSVLPISSVLPGMKLKFEVNKRKRKKPEQNNFNAGNPQTKKHHWLTPPDLLKRIGEEFGDFYDPCPYPLPDGYDGLAAEWGPVNYVNPPFGTVIVAQGKKKGMTAWVRKAIEEQQKGKTTILVYPEHGWVHMLVEAGAEFRPIGKIYWLATEDGSGAQCSSPIMMFVLRGKQK
jgi:hypothetical protein